MKGILFKPESIQAVIEGRKTQTRRVIKPQPKQINNDFDGTWEWKEKGHYYDDLTLASMLSETARYQVGETVYVKEKALYWDGGAGGRSNIAYQDDPEIPHLLEDNNRLLVARETTNILAGEPVVGKWQWKPPMFMAEEAARYFITITDVRAERLQEITEGDAEAEGLILTKSGWKTHYIVSSATEKFAILWNSLNKDYLWESNPWVFVYTFKQEVIRRR